MNELKHFITLENYAEFRPAGRVSLLKMGQLVDTAIAFASEKNVRKLLVVTLDLSGFPPPLLHQRYELVHGWALASGGKVRAAFVARPEMIDPRKFGVIVAANRGFTADIFPTEEEALAWLLCA